MRGKIILALGIMFVMISCVVNAADVLDIGISARSIGMGRAYTTIKGAGESLFGNPAGMSGIKKAEIESMYGEMSGDVKYTLLGFTFPLNIGNVGVGYVSNKIWDLAITTLDAYGRIEPYNIFSYGNDLYLIGYNKKINDKVSIGSRFKYYKRGSGDLSGFEGSGINIDLGLLYNQGDKVDYGIVLSNIIGGSMGSMAYTNGRVEPMQKGVDIGLGYKGTGVNLYGDLIFREKIQMEMRLGGEWNVWKDLDLRLGMEEKNSGINKLNANYTIGLGYKIGEMDINYAYYYDTLVSINSRHFISLNFTLPGLKVKKVEYPNLIREDLRPDIIIGKQLNAKILQKKLLGIKQITLSEKAKIVKTKMKSKDLQKGKATPELKNKTKKKQVKVMKKLKSIPSSNKKR